MSQDKSFPETKVSLHGIPSESKELLAALCWNSMADLTMAQLAKCPDEVIQALAHTRKHCLNVLTAARYIRR